ncbi:Sec-independent protein translocase protein TatB [Helicobacter bilis]|uniref:Sec-independent protein translocase protein TatB homolog n=1 Tax=Helicobacter bilis TaxID=37372 RepID=A0A4U8U738_9HELI|nr:Sec-independent protein translocase protein TatB [Helicobacter bilis]MCI7411965.1 Sec-independent protein translocase protein TatB [Helicobacter bilis]MDD7296415.1 Sec-independent protein translocase protein TatB [Helicobacter bilis]MDY4399054.1 Sec-independent protein translocase protein TatB [Helicobacter bilis]TLE07820.1 Sec-independent protein translocase subunit TatB [Helicobacter bilis]TLE09544.1 Sec-independent protein translocase subunit TatB [Helicobacter bilis]
MLGFGIGEIILIVIVAIIVLGPDKLPNALIEMAKFVRVVKRTMQDAKDTLDREVNLAEIKKEAQAYKEKLEHSVDISKELNIDDIQKDMQKGINDVQHLFKDYNPKPIQLDTQTNNTESTSTHNENLTTNHADSINKPDSNPLEWDAEFRTQQHRENLDSKNYNLNPATKEANRNLATTNYHTERSEISSMESQQDSSPFSKTQNDNKLDSNPAQNAEKTESANKANHA